MKNYIMPILGLALSGSFAYASILNYSKPLKIPHQEITFISELASSKAELELLKTEKDLAERKLQYTQRVLIKERLAKAKLSAELKNYAPNLLSKQLVNANIAKTYLQPEKKPISPCLLNKVKKIVKNSPIPAARWIELSQELNFPLDFLLTAGKIESHFGTRGRAVRTKNIFNVGNTDGGDYKPVAHDSFNSFNDSFEKGLVRYAQLIRDCYFLENEKISLRTFIKRDFRAVRCSQAGKRYMTDRLAKQKYKIISSLMSEVKSV
jgi:hypothetical protein